MPLTSQPLVSVVTPLYNTEKYLPECIESVLAQTYENWEYLIVNNCSTDRSLEMVQHYAQKNTRIRIHNNTEFLNQMQNWNHAMRQISPKSKYCKVVHADDWLFPECLTRMVEVAEANPSVGIVGAYRLDEDRVNLDGLPYPSTVVPGREICRWSLLGGPYIFGSPTSLLIRSDLIRTRKKFYNESNIHADLEACFDILQSADFGFVHQVLTFTRRHNETLTTFSRRFNTYLIANFIVLKKYGPIYLNREEYEKRLKLKIRNYHRFLARSIFEQREKDFWDYHKRALNNLGHPVSMTELTKAFFPEVLKYTVRKIKQAIEKKQE
ncbi:MAG: glycosyltransferase [Deltaproteobacteria bacterium]|nr:glycosyltransferase [Deltaproteobacteria bacterium]MDL1988775.1 glycosyltransferase [Deltaproteobacteria bacterium]